MTSPAETDAAVPDGAPREVIGLAALTHGAYAGVDLQPIWEGLLGRVRKDPYDAAALMDMGILLQLTGNKDQGLDAQRHALALHKVYVRPGAPDGLRLLAHRPATIPAASTAVAVDGDSAAASGARRRQRRGRRGAPVAGRRSRALQAARIPAAVKRRGRRRRRRGRLLLLRGRSRAVARHADQPVAASSAAAIQPAAAEAAIAAVAAATADAAAAIAASRAARTKC